VAEEEPAGMRLWVKGWFEVDFLEYLCTVLHVTENTTLYFA
jgi:hypothetical protein